MSSWEDELTDERNEVKEKREAYAHERWGFTLWLAAALPSFTTPRFTGTLNQSSLKLVVILFDATSLIRDLSLTPFGAIVSSISLLWSKPEALLQRSDKCRFREGSTF